MPQLVVNNLEIYYEIHGQGEPLVLIGGVGTDTLVWTNVLDTLAQSFQVIIFDNRGAGKTQTTPGPYTTQLLAEDTIALLDALQIEQAHILGHSLGGAVAQILALDYPQRVNKLLLCGTFDKLNPVSQFAVMNAVEMLRSGCAIELIINHNIPWLYSDEFLADPRKQEFLRETALKNPNPQSLMGMEGQASAVLAHDTQHRLEEIQHPTLVVVGEHDIITPARSGERMAEKIPQAQCVVLKDAAHLFVLEQPGPFVEKVLGFL